MNRKILERHLKVACALNQLLSEHSSDHISVEDVCRLSGVPRSTFYRYFYSINEVSIWVFQYLLEKNFASQNLAFGWAHALEQLFLDMLKWKPLFQQFFENPAYDSLFGFASRAGVQNFSADAPKIMGRCLTQQDMSVMEYHGYAQASLCAKWAKDGMLIPPREMAAIMVQFLPPVMLEYTHQAMQYYQKKPD